MGTRSDARAEVSSHQNVKGSAHGGLSFPRQAQDPGLCRQPLVNKKELTAPLTVRANYWVK